ncbi:MAG: nicotinate phosphoribosyltransferase [Bacilli bacterium]|nr:nicotinate phosphoribosyltransferase [Bacilli bacterium]
MDKVNYTMMCDFYELTMANGYLESGNSDMITYFDVFFRTIPDQGGFAIACGLEHIVNYIKKLCFTESDIAYLKSKNIFSDKYLDYLHNFKFTGDIYAVPEGTVVFPYEPIMIIRAKATEAQFIETFVLATINHQSLIATKAQRIVRAAEGRTVSEFGSRRAHGAESATLGARAAYIAGCVGTACTLTDKLYGVPAVGTMAHSWVQMFESEYEAFKKYCEIYPDNALLLVDTYDTLKSGIPNAIKAFNEVLLPMGKRPKGVRLDSGDLAYQSKKARSMLDEAGFPDCLIFASSSLDEYLIRDLLYQEAKIDAFGVGERLITSKSSPIFDGVYKLTAVEENGKIIPKIKISENVEKITTPHFKKVYRLYDKENRKAIADLITVYDEYVDETKEYELFDPNAIWKRKTIYNFIKKELLIPIFIKGKQVYQLPLLKDIRNYCQQEIDSLWEEVTRFENPHRYYVDLSQKLWDLKHQMLEENKIRNNNKKP